MQPQCLALTLTIQGVVGDATVAHTTKGPSSSLQMKKLSANAASLTSMSCWLPLRRARSMNLRCRKGLLTSCRPGSLKHKL